MIVNRRTFMVKKGSMDKAVALMKTVAGRLEHNLTQRIYTPVLGSFDVVVLEGEYADLSTYQKDVDLFAKAAWRDSFMEELNAVTEAGGSNEIWSVDSM